MSAGSYNMCFPCFEFVLLVSIYDMCTAVNKIYKIIVAEVRYGYLFCVFCFGHQRGFKVIPHIYIAYPCCA